MIEDKKIPETTIRGSGRIQVPGYGTFKVSGSGSISPEEIKTSGSCKIPGGLTVDRVNVRGSTNIMGDIDAQEMDFRGSTNIEGNARFDELDKSGSMSIDGDATGGTMHVKGSTKVRGSINVEETLEANGSLKVKGNVEAGNSFEYSGAIDVDGMVSTDKFIAKLNGGDSYVGNGVKARTVEVALSEWRSRRWRDEEIFKTSNIEAEEDVYLENVECNNVSGGEVEIGPGCEIKGTVKYRDSIKVNPNSKLGNDPLKTD
jgi:cytoskeletal protein CcmA (bactofilin family)